MLSRLLRMKLVITAALIATVVMTACGGAATTPSATSAPAATAAPTLDPAEAPTDAAEAMPEVTTATEATVPEGTATGETTDETAGAEDAVTYRIVPEESKASYVVDEVLIDRNNRLNTVVGATNILSGALMIDARSPANSKVGTITVDISTLKSDSDRRDDVIRDRWLESAKFPIVTFVPTSIEGLPSSYTAGEELSFKMTGDMTIRDATKPVTFDVKAKLEGERLIGIATSMIKMSDFNFSPPDVAGIVKASDETILTLEFVALPV